MTTCSAFQFASPRARRPSHGGRRAATLLELQVALVVFGIALMGLCPLVIMQSKQLRKMQTWMQPQTTYYLVPSNNIWARKLGAVATMQTTLPTGQSPPSSTIVNVVSIVSLDRSLTSEQVMAHVTVKAKGSP